MSSPARSTPSAPVRHRFIDLDGMSIFCREAGPPDAPAVLFPHGYPCSSFQYRRLLPALGDRWRVVAPDFPGFGYSDTPALEQFGYDFDAYAHFLQRFADAIGMQRFALYLHDYGSQIGLRLAIAQPARIAALILQNGDIYEDTLGPRYAVIREHWERPSQQTRAALQEAVSEAGYRDEFTAELLPEQVERMPPDLWKLHWALSDTPVRREVMVRLMEGLKANLDWFPRYQQYLRDHRPPTLILWGPRDGYMPAEAGRAYLRDLPDAALHMTDGGHWLLETHFDEVCPLIRDFLERVWA